MIQKPHSNNLSQGSLVMVMDWRKHWNLGLKKYWPMDFVKHSDWLKYWLKDFVKHLDWLKSKLRGSVKPKGLPKLKPKYF